jgi:hypothetical protein
MSRIFAAARVLTLGAFLLTLTACTSPAPLRDTTYYGGVWPGWQDVDVGGFEELGRVTWHSGWLYGKKRGPAVRRRLRLAWSAL